MKGETGNKMLRGKVNKEGWEVMEKSDEGERKGVKGKTRVRIEWSQIGAELKRD